MKIRFTVVLYLLLCAVSTRLAAQSSDVLGMHDFAIGGSSPVQTPGALGCTFCHAPHGGASINAPLWNQTFSKATYTPYTSTTYRQTGQTQPILGQSTSLCLSCHDGTVAVGQSAAYGRMYTQGSMYTSDVLGTQMQGSHPFSFVLPLKDSPDLVASLTAGGKTADLTGAVKLIHGNVECNSCHNPHVQSKDRIAKMFLVLDNSSSKLCLACHDPNRSVPGQVNPLAGWNESIHARATNKPLADAHVGVYDTVARNGCSSCHATHSSQAASRLLRPATPSAPTLDATTQSCVTCHSGGSNLKPAGPDLSTELAKISHPLPAATITSTHDASEPVVLNNNRHATCTDCHSPHGSKQVTSFPDPPVIRQSQTNVAGVSASDGVTVLNPAVNQYENCLRCHGTSTGKQTLTIFGYAPLRTGSGSDQLNLIPEFSPSAGSSHPVMHTRNSALPQPSLLPSMMNITRTSQARTMGVRILCTDCHNSDDNREFGGTGPNGPHGSIYPHILERQYKYNQVADGAAPGTTITKLFAPVDLSATGPYALCAKCHDLSNILSNASFTQHAGHINAGISCSSCHVAHGTAATTVNASGDRMVNFDTRVVGQNGSAPITYNSSTNSCTLTCHTYKHNADKTVTQ